MLKSMKKVRVLNRLIRSIPHGCVAGIFIFRPNEICADISKNSYGMKGGECKLAEVTNHAKRRMKARIGITKGNARKFANKVLREGIRHEDTLGELHRWMDAEYLKFRTANNMRYYAGKLYIFCGERLITVLNATASIENSLPEFIKEEAFKEYQKSRKIKNKKNERKRVELERQEIENSIFEALSEYVQNNHGDDIVVASVKFTKPKVVRINYVSDRKSTDWYKYTDIQGFVKSYYFVDSYLNKIKGMDGTYVSIAEFNEKRM